MNSFVTTLQNLGPMRLAAMGGVAAILLAFFVFLATQIGPSNMSMLYGDLSISDSAEIAANLDGLGVPYQIQQNGAAIFVPSDQVDRLRLTMAQEGLPSGGNLGYELFDEGDGFGTTSFVQNINRVRALEGELARTITTIDRVRSARVHLVLPERQLFSQETQQATASVVLSLRGNGLSGQQAAGIQQLVSFAVPQLAPENVSVIDDRGNVLAQNTSQDDAGLLRSSAEDRRRAEEARLSGEIEQMLSRSLGAGRVMARVSMEMDFDRVEVTAETYDPEGQVARSSQFVQTEETSSDGEAGIDPVTVDGNLPEAEDLGALGGGGIGSSTEATRTEETTNFEISRTIETRVRDGGIVERISVAVMVDGTYSQDEDGNTIYAPRSEAELASIEALVRSAVGFDAQRGDTIEVVNMRFLVEDDLDAITAPDTFLGMETGDMMRIVELVVLGIVAALVILLVIRPLMARALDGGVPVDARDDLAALLSDQAGLQTALADPSGQGFPELPGPETEEDEVEALIDISQVEGRVRASSIKKIGEIVDSHPEEAASIIRNWLYQET